MTKIEIIKARLQKAQAEEKNATNAKIKATAKTVQIQAQEEQAELQEVTQELTESGFVKIKDFFADYEGSKRLMRKCLKRWNRYGRYITLQPTDQEEATSRIYTALLELEPPNAEDITLQSELIDYFGITTLRQYRKAYTTFQNQMRENAQTTNRPQYSQEYGLDGTHEVSEKQAERNELDEVELEMTLKVIFEDKPELLTQLTLRLQGYELTEIANETGTPIATVKHRQGQIKRRLTIAYAIE